MPLPSAAAGQAVDRGDLGTVPLADSRQASRGWVSFFNGAIVTIWIAFSVATWTWLSRKEVSAKSIALAALSK